MARVTSKTKQQTQTYGTTFHIKSQLRDIHQTVTGRPKSMDENQFNQSMNLDLSIVVTRRASGKTTGLLQFIGERLLQLDESEYIAVIVPSEDIGRLFLNEFERFFPYLRSPFVVTPDAKYSLHGYNVREVYFEEIFLISHANIHSICSDFPVIAGVGTIEQPTTITIRV